MRRFILIDPCLCDLGSHPYQYCRDLLDAAEREGFACEAVVHRGFRADPRSWPATHRLDPVLSSVGHSKYTAFGELDRLSPKGRSRPRIAAPWAGFHARRRRRERIETFAREIANVVGGTRPGDVVLVATASELDLAGLARAIRTTAAPRGVAWHVQFHYPLYRGFLDDFRRQDRRLDRIRRLMRGAIEEAGDHTIHLHVTTEELATQHRRLGAGTVGVLPYPVRSSVIASALSKQARGDGRLRVACLGDARPEKQSHLLADIADRVAADPLLATRIMLAVQSNPGFPAGSRAARDRAVTRSLERLAAMPREQVELLGGPLVDGAFTDQLAIADAALLAYDQDRYRCRCSGVTLEAIASGVIPIVTGGGSMARLLAEAIDGHVAGVLAESRPLAVRRAGPMTVRAGRPLSLPIDLPERTNAIVTAVSWSTRGLDPLQLPAAIASLEIEGLPGRSLSLQPDAGGRPSRGLMPLDVPTRSGGIRGRLVVAPTTGADTITLEAISLEAIDTGPRRPASAAGIVVASDGTLVDSIVEAFRELARFPDHYRSTAAAHAAAVADRHAGEALLRAILSAGTQPAGRP